MWSVCVVTIKGYKTVSRTQNITSLGNQTPSQFWQPHPTINICPILCLLLSIVINIFLEQELYILFGNKTFLDLFFLLQGEKKQEIEVYTKMFMLGLMFLWRYTDLSALVQTVDWAACGELQAAQCSHHICGVEPRGLECVRGLCGRWCHQPMGSVCGVVRRGSEGGGREGLAPSTTVPAPGSVRDQGDPLAPANTWRDYLHSSVRIQCVQDNIGVGSVGATDDYRIYMTRKHVVCNAL